MNYSGLSVVGLCQSTDLSCLFHAGTCSGNSHPVEVVISSETSHFWGVCVGDLCIIFVVVGYILSSLEEELHVEGKLLFRY